jgi:hypothetical protein
MLHRLFTEPDPIVRILISMALGAAVVCGAGIVLGKLRQRPPSWRRLFLSVAIALGLTIAGLGFNFFTAPGSFGGIGTIVAAMMLPGVAVTNVFGRNSLEDLPFFGGFVLNVLVWSGCAYAVLHKTQRA